MNISFARPSYSSGLPERDDSSQLLLLIPELKPSQLWLALSLILDHDFMRFSHSLRQEQTFDLRGLKGIRFMSIKLCNHFIDAEGDEICPLRTKADGFQGGFFPPSFERR